MFLAVQPSRRERRQAIPILEGLTGRNEATPEDQFLLAQLYEADGNWPKARHRLKILVVLPASENPRSLAHRAYYANLLLTHGENEEAQVCSRSWRNRNLIPSERRRSRREFSRRRGRTRKLCAAANVRQGEGSRGSWRRRGAAGRDEGSRGSRSLYRDYVTARPR